MTRLLAILAMLLHHGPRAKYDRLNDSWSCPPGYSLYADETRALAGQRFVYCVRDNDK